MKLDIRYPIGFLFVIIGSLLAAYSLVRGTPTLRIDLWWGLVQVAFGAVMLVLAFRGSGKPSAS
jgi:hypothetical protein